MSDRDSTALVAPTPEEAQAVIDRAIAETEAVLCIVKLLAPLAPEYRRRILSAVCEMHGIPNPLTRGMRA